MDLRSLRLFVVAAEELHFRRAAERVHLTQSSLSRQIQRLESELGAELFDRSRRRVQLTPVGKRLLAEAGGLLAEASRVRRAIDRAVRGETGKLTIGFAEPTLYGPVASTLRAFAEKHPGVELVLRPMQTPDQVGALLSGRIDVAICSAPPSSGVEEAVLAHEWVSLAIPTGHILAQKQSVRLEDAAKEPFVFPSRSWESGLFDLLTGLCSRAGFSPRIVQEAEGVFNLLGLVAAGFGVAFAPSVLTGRLHGVTVLPLADTSHVITTRALWRQGDPNPVVRAFSAVANARSGKLKA